MGSTTYSFTTVDYVPPFLRNRNPDSGETGVLQNVNIEFDLLDDSAVHLSTVDAYVDGVLAYEHGVGFLSGFDGPGSAVTTTVVDGYDGYHFVIDPTAILPGSSFISVRVSARDGASNHLDETYTFRTAPGINDIQVDPFEITLLVTFSEPMTGDLDNPANYMFSDGMYARLAEVVDPSQRDQVRLWVELFEGDGPFDVAVSGITDSYGGALPSGTLFNLTRTPSEANISHVNGRVRTWHDSLAVAQDDARVYLAGTKGVDIVDKTAGTLPPARWAQIFDDYAVGTLFLAHFGDTHLFQDLQEPFLENRTPAPSGSAAPGDTIFFSISDEDTAVEIVSVAVYLNSVLAFQGADSGFVNGHSGQITVGYKTLNFQLNPPSPFVAGTTASVRVVATDLKGNTVDETWSFSVLAAMGGFGTSGFGTAPFGGT